MHQVGHLLEDLANQDPSIHLETGHTIDFPYKIFYSSKVKVNASENGCEPLAASRAAKGP